MKKLFAVLISTVLCAGSFSMVFADDPERIDYEITSDGEITAYYGDEWASVPGEINGIPVVKIGEKAFFDLGILDAYLPEGLSVIGKSAFEGSNIESVDIPSTVSVIAENAFANCRELETVFTKFDEKAVIEEGAFYGTGHLLFYVDCDVNMEELEKKLTAAKGDGNYETIPRHVAFEYDETGNGICGACGYTEKADIEPLPFEDVPFDAWYYDAVYSAYHNRIISGKSETVFDPDAGMTCAEAAKIAACINAIFTGAIEEYTEGAWYQPYVEHCYKYGLIEKDVVFDWNKPITRGQMAYIFSHCDPYEEWYTDINDVPITDIPDVNNRTSYAPEILVLYNKGIAVGDENMSFFPDANIKRCEAAAIVSRIMDWKTRIELPKG